MPFSFSNMGRGGALLLPTATGGLHSQAPLPFAFLRSIIPLPAASFSSKLSVRASSGSSPPSPTGAYRGPRPKSDSVTNWISENDGTVRSLPIFAGGASLVAVLFNRALSSIAPVADATSSQSRADILTLALAITNILAGLVWLSIKPKNISPEDPVGVPCRWVNTDIPRFAVDELLWAWNSLSEATCCRSLVILHRGICLIQTGVAAKFHDGAVPVDVPKLSRGSLYQNALKSKKQSYLANLSLYPGRSELPFLPSNTQNRKHTGKWIMDNGCSRHMTGNVKSLSDYKKDEDVYVVFGNNQKGSYLATNRG